MGEMSRDAFRRKVEKALWDMDHGPEDRAMQYVVCWSDRSYPWADHSETYTDYRDALEAARLLRRCCYPGVTINGNCEF